MSPSPEDGAAPARQRQYASGWQQIMERVRNGQSWSGEEKNVAFLNVGDGTFADASGPMGFDHEDDTRGLALTDWDHDGDLDVWLRNRTAPRLRFLRNRSAIGPPRTLSLKLAMPSGNRDAIGAVVEVLLQNPRPRRRLVRSVRAGDLFLSQSGKELHFAFGAEDEMASLQVLWPGGQIESFSGLEIGRRYRIEPGTGPELLSLRKAPVLSQPSPSSPVPAIEAAAPRRWVFPGRLPLPPCRYRNSQGEEKAVVASSAVSLLILWSPECSQCEGDLRALATHEEAFRQAGVGLLALSVEPEQEAGRKTMEAVGDGVPWGMIEAASAARLQTLPEALFDARTPRYVPQVFLLDSGARTLAFYQAPIDWEQILKDSRRLPSLKPEELRTEALPFPGRWINRAATSDQLAEWVGRQFLDRLPEDALPYLTLAAGQIPDGDRLDALKHALSRTHYHLGRRAGNDEKSLAGVTFHFEKALHWSPHEAAIHRDYGSLLGDFGEWEVAEKHLKRSLQLNPEDSVARKNLERLAELRR
ncbi:MAG: CRTAC1 family protein [Verrucomicrobiota bacterium]